MKLSILNLQDPRHDRDRRLRIRHKLHSPIHASFVGVQSGMLSDGNELLNVHEAGFSFRTSDNLHISQPMNVCLDLQQTNAFVHGAGHVVWTDAKGQGGFVLSRVDNASRRQLKEWLLLNLLTAGVNHSARQEQREKLALEDAEPRLVPDLSALLSAVDAVRREIAALGDNLEGVLQLITERALSFTSASGAALAFLRGDQMICRGRAGDPAPQLGALVDTKHGLSGECVRTGRFISCHDTADDPRVDGEICRDLGIGSILAVPIVSDHCVVGLLEVFSSYANVFTRAHETALDRLAELAANAAAGVKASRTSSDDAVPVHDTQTSAPTASEDSSEPETAGQEKLRGVPVRLSHLLVLFMAGAITALAMGYAAAPFIERLAGPRLAKIESSAEPDSSVAPSSVIADAKSPEDLRKLAEQGDANAQWLLGVRYHSGDGVPQDDAQAAQWFIRAAEQGHVVAQATLGAYYWAGRGVPQDLSKAYFWSVLARAGNDEASKYRVAVLTARLSRAQVAAVQQQAEEWIRQHSAGAKPTAN